MRKSSSQERNKSTRNELNKEKETDIPQRVHHATNATVQKHGVELLQCVDTHTHLMQKAISETGKKKKKSDVTYDEIRKKKKNTMGEAVKENTRRKHGTSRENKRYRQCGYLQ